MEAGSRRLPSRGELLFTRQRKEKERMKCKENRKKRKTKREERNAVEKGKR